MAVFIIARSHSLIKIIISVFSFCHLHVFSEIERWKEGKAVLSKLQLQEISPGSVCYVLDGTENGVSFNF